MKEAFCEAGDDAADFPLFADEEHDNKESAAAASAAELSMRLKKDLGFVITCFERAGMLAFARRALDRKGFIAFVLN